MCAGQVRSAKLADVPCTCLALLDALGDTLSSHPIALTGCYNNQVPASLFNWPDATVTGLLQSEFIPLSFFYYECCHWMLFLPKEARNVCKHSCR